MREEGVKRRSVRRSETLGNWRSFEPTTGILVFAITPVLYPIPRSNVSVEKSPVEKVAGGFSDFGVGKIGAR